MFDINIYIYISFSILQCEIGCLFFVLLFAHMFVLVKMPFHWAEKYNVSHNMNESLSKSPCVVHAIAMIQIYMLSVFHDVLIVMLLHNNIDLIHQYMRYTYRNYRKFWININFHNSIFK